VPCGVGASLPTGTDSVGSVFARGFGDIALRRSHPQQQYHATRAVPERELIWIKPASFCERQARRVVTVAALSGYSAA
jgi:hypothetical protein